MRNRLITTCLFSIILLITTATNAIAEDKIKVRIFTDQKIQTLEFTPLSKGYRFLGDDKFIENIPLNKTIFIKLEGNRINVYNDSASFGIFDKIQFDKLGFINSFKVKATAPYKKEITLDDGLIIKTCNTGLLIINNINIDYYVAGVVEAEGGMKAHIEYYKTQAILCRTYVLSHLDRHISEGYNICDKVHCQAYKGKCRNSDILMASIATRGMALVDASDKFIDALFHSNCGGETANSEDVWGKSLSYLRSVKDSFCTDQTNSHWEKKIKLSDWMSYMARCGCNISIENQTSQINSKINCRKTVFESNNTKIPLTKIRNDWGLKSTIFNITIQGDNVILKGRGHGHGVGLCQEGAMRMANLGHTYDEIIKHYYKGVRIKYQPIIN